MRRTFPFSLPTLLLCFFIQCLESFLPCMFNLLTAYALAQAPITQSGLNTQVSPPVTLPGGQTQYNITGGTRPGGGTNLFHSFGDFNVPNNNIANFLNNSGLATSNILGRVTGGNLSSIFGTIQTTGFGNANLFLMNPAGFLFGPNATVNVGGMVAFTSADYLRLEGAGGNGIFHADAGQTSVLTTAPVAAYGFLGSNPGAITVLGSQLTVTPGQSLSLVGGNITVQSGTLDNGTVQSAKLSAPGGQITLASVASPGEILAGSLAQAPNINGQSFGNLGALQVSEQSVLDVSGNGGGTVLIRGGQFLLDNSTISANTTGPGPVTNGVEKIGDGIDIQLSQSAALHNGALIDTSVTGNATPGVRYGGVHVKADQIEIVGSVDLEAFAFTPSEIRSTVAAGSTGGGSGDIRLEANSILLKTFGAVRTRTEGIGDAGHIFVTANQNLILEDVGTVVSGSFFGSGNAGNIELTSTHGNILIPGGTVTSQAVRSSGNAGSITLNAREGDIILSSSFFGPGVIFTETNRSTGTLGGIQITAKNLQLLDGSNIEGDTFNNNVTTTKPGSIDVTLSGSLSLDRGSSITTIGRGQTPAADLNISAHDVNIAEGSFVSAETVGSGPGGNLNIATNTLQLTNGGQVRSGSDLDPFPIPGETPPIPSGQGGTINIQGLTGPATSVLIDGAESGIFTNTVGTGAAGNTNISAQSVTIQNGGTISAATTGTVPSATGGTITVNADTVTLNTGGTITAASSGAGASGEIIVQGLASSAQSILIDGAGSGIFTNTQSSGTGGDIHLFSNSVALQNGGTLSAATSGTASSATGGTITVNANEVVLNNQAHITADTNGIAPAGVVNINTGTLAINSGGQIRSNSGAETEQLSAFALSPTAAPTLTGGTINIQGQTGNGSQADNVTIDGAGSGIFTQSSGNRPGGDINILTNGSVTMANGATISASSTGSGNAGNIQINAGNQLAMTNSSVTTEAHQASGGAIKITTAPSGMVELTNSTISASVLDGTGGGGSVNIDPQFVILQNSQILADAVFGPGGNINITTNLLLPDTTSVIRASSQFGQQGNIIIQSPISPASGKILPLGQKPLLATTLLGQRCAALAGGNASSFTVAGRDALPVEPGGWISSPLALSMAESNEGTATETAFSSFSEMAAETPLLSLRKIAPPGFLTQSFGVEASDCHS